MRIALSIEYNGANYFGWQKQKTHKEKTIQYYVDKAISKIADEKVNTTCAGRTDTGVHAFSQIVHFDTNKKRLDYKWLNGINSNTPNDIIIKNIYHHVGIYSFTYQSLKNFITLPPSANELVYKLEQLRALDAKMNIGASFVKNVALSVDTKEDLIKVESILKFKNE